MLTGAGAQLSVVDLVPAALRVRENDGECNAVGVLKLDLDRIRCGGLDLHIGTNGRCPDGGSLTSDQFTAALDDCV